MNPLQLRETTIDPDTCRLIQLVLDGDDTDEMMGMLLAKKRASNRCSWLESKGSLAEIWCAGCQFEKTLHGSRAQYRNRGKSNNLL